MTWDVICQVLEKFSPKTKKRIGFERCENLMLFYAGAPDSPGTVYVSECGESRDSYRQALIITLGGHFPCADNLISLQRGNLPDIFNTLAETRHFLDSLSAQLSLCTGEQEIVDAASAHTGKPMFCLDQSYRILAITRNLDFQGDPEWTHMTEKGYLSPESTQRMKESGDLELLAAAKGPVPYITDIYPFPCIVSNILADGVAVSRLNFLCIEEGITPLLLRCVELISLHLSRTITGSGKLIYDDALHLMLIDLLRGQRLSDELISDRLRAFPELGKNLLQLYFVDVEGRAEGQVASYYAALLRHLYPEGRFLSIVYDQQLVLLSYAPDESGFEPFIEKLERFCSVHHLRCGVSNRFRKIAALAGHYAQASAALGTLGESGLRFYQDIMLEHILSHIPDEKIRFLISPDIARLEDANRKFSFSLTDTLKCYLECNCNLIRCSQQLFLHKNTLLYRLNHIRSIIHSDLDDADQRLLLMLSFRLMERKINN